MSREIMEKMGCPLCGSKTFVTDENCAEEPARYCISQDCDWYGSVNMIEHSIVDKVLGLSIEYDHPSYSSRLRSKERMWEAMQAVGCLVNKEIERLLAQERKEVLYELLAFNTQLGCTPQEGYKDLTDALRDTKHLVASLRRDEREKARASVGEGK